jgi:hypothetical protein
MAIASRRLGMGYNRHHAIVVTGPRKSYGRSDIDANLDKTIYAVQRSVYDLAGKHGYAFLIGPVVESAANSYGSFLVAPDGSKEGWRDSEQGDVLRNEIITYLETLRYGDGSTSFDYVEVQFGDDNLETKVIRDSDQARRSEAVAKD